MKKLAAPLLILFFIVLNLLSCDGLDENYSNNPNHRLSFSVDTLSFDTVFTTIGSATKEFMIYNRNDQPLLISEIMLASGEETGFRINVDGRKGDVYKRQAGRRFHHLHHKRSQTVCPPRSIRAKCKPV